MPSKRNLTLSFCLPPLYLSHSTSSPFTSLTLPPHVLSMPPNLQICVSTHILPVSSHLTFSLFSILHLFISASNLCSPLTHPAHLNNPLTVFIHLFSLFPFPLCLILSSLYPLFHPVACPCLFLSPALLFIIYFFDLICLFYLFYLSSFISFHYFPLKCFVSATFLFTPPSSLHILHSITLIPSPLLLTLSSSPLLPLSSSTDPAI